MKDKVKQFMTELNAIQEEYGLYIVSEAEEELLISLERNDNPTNIVCYVGSHSVSDFDDDRSIIDVVNIEKVQDNG